MATKYLSQVSLDDINYQIKDTEARNLIAEINKKKHALSDTIDGEALRSKAVSITRPANILTAAASMPIRTEQIFFNGSDGVSAGGPVNYILVNAKKGDNHRTILDCYDLQTGDHYINGCMRAEANSTADGANVWTGWKLQPSPNNTYTKTEVNQILAQTSGIFTISNITVASNAWVSSSYNSMYPYEATITISNLTANDIVQPRYNNMDIINYTISPEMSINNGSFTIYAVNRPTTTMTIPEINCYQTI